MNTKFLIQQLQKLSLILGLLFNLPCISQEVLNSTLLSADKLYIKRDYANAVNSYLIYLEKYPRDYYAERQTAICYTRLNIPDMAIDHWPIVVESSEASESDYLEYGKSLLANNRAPEAKKIFGVLSRSNDKSMAAWAKAYLNPAFFYKDSATTKVIEVNGINTSNPEFCPVISKEKLFYVSDFSNYPQTFYALNDVETQKISGALKKDSTHLFPTFIYEKLHNMQLSGPVSFSPDGAFLYFSRVLSNEEMNIKTKLPFYRYQLFTLTMSTINNYAPEIKKFKYNLPDYDFMHPTVSADGKRLYFSSNMKGSMGGKDIFVCEWLNGSWGAPVNVGSEVNTPGNELFPAEGMDSTIYFASDRRPGLGGLDLFYAKLSITKGKIFEEAQNAGAPINSRFDDFGICFLKSAKRGYLSSNRKTGIDLDIYYFYRIESK